MSALKNKSAAAGSSALRRRGAAASPNRVNAELQTLDRRAWMLVFALVLATLAIYWPVLKFGFINYDDPDYGTDNPMVRAGLSLRGVWWALTTGCASNWHPVTWLSHLTDATIFGANAGGHHLVNVLLHAANAALLFALLRKLTGAVWRSAIVAALWAVHPLHVESVAWVSERKDVLSGLFGLLTLYFYARYASKAERRASKAGLPLDPRPSTLDYRLALLFFALGLMSKPMLVTWPLVMLLLDFWPLNRVSSFEFRVSSWGKLVVEKIPFFALSAASCVVTVIVQRAGGAVQSVQNVPWLARLENTPVAYARYLGKTFWPVNLIVPYTHPGHWPLLWVLGGLLLLVAVSVVVVRQRRRAPFLLMGWLWFVGTLVPVIGLLQVGGQSMADRYTYLPHIGLFIALVWGAAEAVRRWALGVRLGVVILILGACALRAHDQLRYWRNSETLFRHALAVAPENEMAMENLGVLLLTEDRSRPEALALLEVYARNNPTSADGANNYGLALQDAGRTADAQMAYEYALRLKPDMAEAHINLATALIAAGRRAKALEHLQTALRLAPDNFKVQVQLGLVCALEKNFADAITHYQAALRLAPDDADTHYNLGQTLTTVGQHGEAVEQYRAALRLNPQHSDARNNLCIALLTLGSVDEAIGQLRQLLRDQPDYAPAHDSLAVALAGRQQFAEAETHFRAALRLAPTVANTHFNFGRALLMQHRCEDAVQEFNEALKLSPQLAVARTGLADAHFQLGLQLAGQKFKTKAILEWHAALLAEPEHRGALNGLAWTLATDKNAAVRDGAEALRLATHLVQVTQTNAPEMLDTLAAAYAETGDYAQAIQTAHAALALLAANTNHAALVELQTHLKTFQARQPWRE
jgi:tetratricopeptide (TPR) repeat protein